MMEMKLRNYADVKKNLVLAPMAYTKVPEDAVFHLWNDIAFSARALFDDRSLIITDVITKEMAAAWGVSPDTVIADAVRAMSRSFPVVIKPMPEFMGVLGEDVQDGDVDVLVVSNEKLYFGFSSIMFPGVMEGIHKKLGDFYILPSSKHEALLIPADPGDPFRIEKLYQTVCEINASGVVAENDVLTDNVYYCDNNGAAAYKKVVSEAC